MLEYLQDAPNEHLIIGLEQMIKFRSTPLAQFRIQIVNGARVVKNENETKKS